jgi:hypothetical protein
MTVIHKYTKTLEWCITAIAISVLLAIISTIFIVLLVFALDFIYFESFDCYIKNVNSSYFTNNTMGNITEYDYYNFITCRGNTGVSELGTCIQLFAVDVNNMNQQPKMIRPNTIKKRLNDDKCTISFDECNAEMCMSFADLSNDLNNIYNTNCQERINAINHAQDIALEYYNTIQTCYRDTRISNSHYFLHNEKNISIITFSLIGIFIMLIIYIYTMCRATKRICTTETKNKWDIKLKTLSNELNKNTNKQHAESLEDTYSDTSDSYYSDESMIEDDDRYSIGKSNRFMIIQEYKHNNQNNQNPNNPNNHNQNPNNQKLDNISYAETDNSSDSDIDYDNSSPEIVVIDMTTKNTHIQHPI